VVVTVIAIGAVVLVVAVVVAILVVVVIVALIVVVVMVTYVPSGNTNADCFQNRGAIFIT
jgi:hypothetical protein